VAEPLLPLNYHYLLDSGVGAAWAAKPSPRLRSGQAYINALLQKY